eukprot:TRINITY_DN17085_c0_g2_i1.p1 TRINITY_DN17085_c0_g2~~TRINITY_DN17085_c0_g2_i1.p1  ORF type:complete len:412 (+),score=142.65 TRINITY_DN17085_c0_g2_i1:55-1236(+)
MACCVQLCPCVRQRREVILADHLQPVGPPPEGFRMRDMPGEPQIAQPLLMDPAGPPTPLAQPVGDDFDSDGQRDEFESCHSAGEQQSSAGLCVVRQGLNDTPEPPAAPTESPRLAECGASAAAVGLIQVPALPPGLADTVRLKADVKPKLMVGWNFLTDPSDVDVLRRGSSLYNFVCSPGTRLSAVERCMVASFIGLSAVGGATVNIHSEAEAAAHIFILNKAMYVLPPPARRQLLTTQLLSSVEYQKSCQPGNPKIWTDVTDLDTFRFTKPIIPWVYSLTIQMRVSVLSDAQCRELSAVLCGGLPLCHGLLLERTKRNESYIDSTRCVKSLLLYHALAGGGLLVISCTAIANTTIPSIVARIVDSQRTQGALEVQETAERTRDYFQKKFGRV